MVVKIKTPIVGNEPMEVDSAAEQPEKRPAVEVRWATIPAVDLFAPKQPGEKPSNHIAPSSSASAQFGAATLTDP